MFYLLSASLSFSFTSSQPHSVCTWGKSCVCLLQNISLTSLSALPPLAASPPPFFKFAFPKTVPSLFPRRGTLYGELINHSGCLSLCQQTWLPLLQRTRTHKRIKAVVPRETLGALSVSACRSLRVKNEPGVSMTEDYFLCERILPWF